VDHDAEGDDDGKEDGNVAALAATDGDIATGRLATGATEREVSGGADALLSESHQQNRPYSGDLVGQTEES